MFWKRQVWQLEIRKGCLIKFLGMWSGGVGDVCVNRLLFAKVVNFLL